MYDETGARFGILESVSARRQYALISFRRRLIYTTREQIGRGGGWRGEGWKVGVGLGGMGEVGRSVEGSIATSFLLVIISEMLASSGYIYAVIYISYNAYATSRPTAPRIKLAKDVRERGKQSFSRPQNEDFIQFLSSQIKKRMKGEEPRLVFLKIKNSIIKLN